MPPPEHRAITRTHVEGYRSLQRVDLEPGRVTVRIGANGAGRSNVTKELNVRLEFEQSIGTNAYGARLGYAAGDTLLYLDETVEVRRVRTSWLTLAMPSSRKRMLLSFSCRRAANAEGLPLTLLSSSSGFLVLEQRVPTTSGERKSARSGPEESLRHGASSLS